MTLMIGTCHLSSFDYSWCPSLPLRVKLPEDRNFECFLSALFLCLTSPVAPNTGVEGSAMGSRGAEQKEACFPWRRVPSR